MTRNYNRLWQRPHRPHRDSPYPDIPSEPVYLYTHQNVHLDPYFVIKYHQNLPNFDTKSDHSEASGEDEWEDCNSVDYENGQNCESVNYENSDHEPPDNDYYDHSDGDYYHDDERQEQRFEPNYDYQEKNFDRQPSEQDYDDYDYYEGYPDDPEALDHQFQRLEIEIKRPEHDTFSSCNTPNEESHFAYKDVFYHEDAAQHFHLECSECIRYMDQNGFSVPPPGYNYNQHRTGHDPWPALAQPTASESQRENASALSTASECETADSDDGNPQQI